MSAIERAMRLLVAAGESYLSAWTKATQHHPLCRRCAAKADALTKLGVSVVYGTVSVETTARADNYGAPGVPRG